MRRKNTSSRGPKVSEACSTCSKVAVSWSYTALSSSLGVFGWPYHAWRGYSRSGRSSRALAHLNARTRRSPTPRVPAADISAASANGLAMPWYQRLTGQLRCRLRRDECTATTRSLRDGDRCFLPTSSRRVHERWDPSGVTIDMTALLGRQRSGRSRSPKATANAGRATGGELS